jgi:hypothetical protein
MPTLSTRLGIPAPLSSDLVSGGPADFTAANAVIDGIYGTEYGDILQAGVVGNAVLPNSTGPSINSSTGVVTVTLNADVAWVTVSGVLTRCLLPTAGTPLTPSSLPTSPNFKCFGIYVAPAGVWSTTGSLSGALGTSQSTAAAALANPPATPSGTLLLEYVVIGNSSGTYSIASTTDERVFASYGLGSANRAWTVYTPLWSSLGTQPAIGNGTLTGAYRQLGKLVAVRLSMNAGTTTTFGTGGWRVTLPFAASASQQSVSGIASPSANAVYGVCAWLQASSNQIAVYTAAGVVVDATDPAAWGNLGTLAMNGVYETS